MPRPIQPLSVVNFSEPLKYNAQKKTFQPLAWKDWLLRFIPFYGVYQDQKIMDIMLDHMQNSQLPVADRVQWAEKAKKFEKNVLGSYYVSIPGARKEFSQKIYLAALEELGLPRDVASKHPEFVKFIKINHLDKMIKVQNHTLKVDEDSQEPMILVEGEYKKWSEVKEILGLSSRDMLMSEKGWSYLGASDFGKAGLVKYDAKEWEIRPGDVTHMPRPFRKLTPEEISELKDANGRPVPLPYIENIVDCRARKFPDRTLENNDHSYKKMIDSNGNVYYFGYSPKEAKSFLDEHFNNLASHKAVLESPDHFAYVPPAYRVGLIQEANQEKFDAEFNYLVTMHNFGSAYCIFGNNCLEMVLGADEAAKLPVPRPQDVNVKFYKIFPKPLQFIYNWFPMPRVAKRWVVRKVLNIAGFNSGTKVGDYVISAQKEKSIWKDLTMAHPRQYLNYLYRLKNLKDSKVIVYR
jgi:hypothetical protein